jgi:hypothetical protein
MGQFIDHEVCRRDGQSEPLHADEVIALLAEFDAVKESRCRQSDGTDANAEQSGIHLKLPQILCYLAAARAFPLKA